MLFLRALSLVLLMLPFCVEGVGSPQPSQEMFVAISSDKGNMTFGPGFLCWASHFPETSEDATYYYYFFFHFSLFPKHYFLPPSGAAPAVETSLCPKC